jgi:NADH-quinone oxidoreductase subunit J
MTTGQVIFATLVVLLGGGGTYLLLPHRHAMTQTRSAHVAGASLASLGLCGFLTFWSPAGPFLSGFFFYLFGIGAVVGGVMTVISKNPIYSALWFASVVLSTAGLFVLAGAQFLAAGTVIVYAGAIIVTFLFVIMLAQMEGKARYDRAARAPASATLTCFLLFWCLLYTLGSLRTGQWTEGRFQTSDQTALIPSSNLVPYRRLNPKNPPFLVLNAAQPPTSLLRDASGAQKPNVAGLGEALYTDYLVTVELAGILLFVALIAAVAMTNPRRPADRPGDVPGPPAART